MKQDCFFIKRQKTLQNRNFKSERTLYLEAQNPANSNAESGKILSKKPKKIAKNNDHIF